MSRCWLLGVSRVKVLDRRSDFCCCVVANEKVVVSALAKDLSIAQRGRREECKAMSTWKVAVVNPHGRTEVIE